MASYGIPYQGSKDKLVHKISACLPKDKDHFYDLFGGGFSVSHYMAFHNKYPHVHYNELEPSTVQLVQDAIAGNYNYKVFKPKWISREEFFANLDDAYTRIVWSFGNNQKGYIFGKDIEQQKRSLHQAIIFDEFDSTAIEILGFSKWPAHLSMKGRRLACRATVRKRGERLDLQQLEQLERLEQLQQLERLERGLTFSSLSYDEVDIKPNSIIYCDPPYKGTAKYTRSFDHDKFWQWVRTNPNPVYVSEYTAPEDIKVVAAFRHKKSNAPNTRTDSVEKLYWNGK